MRNFKLPPYIVPYGKRKHFTRKVRETLKEIEKSKHEGDWDRASWLEYTLRNSWWGYKGTGIRKL